jgi:hypothetical protein
VLTNCKDASDRVAKVMADIERLYDSKPIVLIYDDEQLHELKV